MSGIAGGGKVSSPTVRTQAQLQSVWPDNNQADISAADGRDFIATAFGFAASRNPTSLDDNADSGGTGQYFDLGNRWLNTATQIEWVCWSGAVARAIWQPLAGGTSACTDVQNCLRTLPGYNAANPQVLTHDNTGNFEWVDTGTC